MRCDWHTSRYCHVWLGLCSWACELIPVASKSTPPLLSSSYTPTASLLPSPPSPCFFHFPFSPVTLLYTLAEPCGELCSSANRYRARIQQQVRRLGFPKQISAAKLTKTRRAIHKSELASAAKSSWCQLFCLGTPLQMTWLIETNKGRLREERNTNCEAGYGETGRRNRD